MPHSRPGIGELAFPTAEIFDIAETVFVLEGPGDDVTPDEVFGMRMCAEASGGGYSIFIYDAEGAKGLVAGIARIIASKGECMISVEPVVVGVAAGVPRALDSGKGCGGGGCGHCAEESFG